MLAERRGDLSPLSKRGLLIGKAASASMLLALTGVGDGLESQLSVWRDGLHPRAASGRLALVEIDARSLRELDRWPWPRSLQARAIDALSAAGTATIAFDVDFSARSDPAQDAALARAIARSRLLAVLATFRQGRIAAWHRPGREYTVAAASLTRPARLVERAR